MSPAFNPFSAELLDFSAVVKRSGDVMLGDFQVADTVGAIKTADHAMRFQSNIVSTGGARDNFVFHSTDYTDDSGDFMRWENGPGGDHNTYLRVDTNGVLYLTSYPGFSDGVVISNTSNYTNLTILNSAASGTGRGLSVALDNQFNISSDLTGIDVNITGDTTFIGNVGVKSVVRADNWLVTFGTTGAYYGEISQGNANIYNAFGPATGYLGNGFYMDLRGASIRARFLNFVTDEGEKYLVFSNGASVQYGPTVTGFGYNSVGENLLTYSEDMGGTGWVNAGWTVATDYENNPFYNVPNADRLTDAAGSALISNTMPTLAASKTITTSCWFKKTAGSTITVELTTSDGSEGSGGQNLIPSDDRWQLLTFTHTFTPAATGTLKLEIRSSAAVTSYDIRWFGWNVSETPSLIGYTPTLTVPIAASLRTYAREQLFVWTPDAASSLIVREGGVQGGANLAEIQNAAGAVQIDIDSNFDLNLPAHFVTAKYNSGDGSLGVTAGPYTAITSITVKDGIVTALTGS